MKRQVQHRVLPRSVRRRRRFWLTGRSAAQLLAVTFFGATVYAALAAPAMVIRGVVVVTSNLAVEHEVRRTREMAAVGPTERLLTVDWRTPAARLQSLPWVRDVIVSRDWLGRRLVFTVLPRRPVVALASGNHQWELDEEGCVIRPLRRGAILPRIRMSRQIALYPGRHAQDVEVQGAVATYLLMPAIEGLRAREIRVDQTGAICFNNVDRVVVVVGTPADLPHKLAVVAAIYKTQPDLAATFSRVNVSSPRYPAGTPRTRHEPAEGNQPAT